MKKILCLAIASSITTALLAQDTTAIKAGWGSLDYAVPQSPASQIMGTGVDNIIKPTSVRKIAVNVGNYLFNSSSVIPKTMAVEISPLLLNNKVSLNDYNNHKFWYRTRLSFGTSVGANGSYNMAQGLRITLIDKTDLRDFSSNPGFTKYLYSSATNTSIAINKAINLYIQTHPQENLIPVMAMDKYNSDSTFKATINDLSQQFYDPLVNINAISKYRDSVKAILWNAPIWEMGLASMQSSPDSLVKHLKFSQFNFWSTAGFPVAKKGQLLIGAKVSVTDSVSWFTNVSIGERLYYGSNEFRGFLQAQYDYKYNTNYFTTSLGCQFNIGNGFWGDFTFNLIVDGTGKLSYQPGFSLALATPEKKK